MNVSEAKNVISKINICRNAMMVLQKNEKDSFYKDCFKMSDELLEQYKELLLDKIEQAKL